MIVLRGGSAETANGKWVKFDVTLDESDLQAEVIHNSLDLSAMTVIQKYSLLTKLAELLVTVRMEDLGAKGDKTASQLSQAYKNYLITLPKMK